MDLLVLSTCLSLTQRYVWARRMLGLKDRKNLLSAKKGTTLGAHTEEETRLMIYMSYSELQKEEQRTIVYTTIMMYLAYSFVFYIPEA